MYSLRQRLIILLTVGLGTVFIIVGLVLHAQLKTLVETYVLSRLEHDADMLYAKVLETADLHHAAQAMSTTVYALPLSGHYFLLERGTEQMGSRSLWDETLHLSPRHAEAATAIIELSQLAGQPLLVLRKPYDLDADTVWITVAEDISIFQQTLESLRGFLLVGLSTALLGLFIVHSLMIRRALRPLDEAIIACQRIERGEAVTLPLRGPQEIVPLLQAVNQLAHYHNRRLTRIRHALANLSHALKTPLTRLYQLVEMQESSSVDAQAMHSELDAMHHSIDRELRRAQLAGGGFGTHRFMLAPQLRELATALQRLYAERITLHMEIPPREYPLDAQDMLELFGNLLDNAHKWARSTVTLRVLDTPQLTFYIEDDGPGMNPATLERLAKGVMRYDEKPLGHGLGLLIVHDIVAQYAGRIEFSRSATLGGLSVSVRLFDP